MGLTPTCHVIFLGVVSQTNVTGGTSSQRICQTRNTKWKTRNYGAGNQDSSHCTNSQVCTYTKTIIQLTLPVTMVTLVTIIIIAIVIIIVEHHNLHHHLNHHRHHHLYHCHHHHNTVIACVVSSISTYDFISVTLIHILSPGTLLIPYLFTETVQGALIII